MEWVVTARIWVHLGSVKISSITLTHHLKSIYLLLIQSEFTIPRVCTTNRRKLIFRFLLTKENLVL